jgi:hypothetical protein
VKPRAKPKRVTSIQCHPENDLDIGPVPAIADMVGEEAPRVVVVLIGEENAHAIVARRARVVVVSPYDAKIERASGCHYGNVWERPSAVVISERVDGLEEEGMTGYSAHGIVGDTSGERAAHPGGVGEERIEAAIASLEACQCQSISSFPEVRTSSKSM